MDVHGYIDDVFWSQASASKQAFIAGSLLGNHDEFIGRVGCTALDVGNKNMASTNCDQGSQA